MECKPQGVGSPMTNAQAQGVEGTALPTRTTGCEEGPDPHLPPGLLPPRMTEKQWRGKRTPHSCHSVVCHRHHAGLSEGRKDDDDDDDYDDQGLVSPT